MKGLKERKGHNKGHNNSSVRDYDKGQSFKYYAFLLRMWPMIYELVKKGEKETHNNSSVVSLIMTRASESSVMYRYCYVSGQGYTN